MVASAESVMKRVLPIILAAVLVLPSAIWAFRDHSIWDWDPAFYGMGAVDIWAKLSHDPRQWWEAMLHVYTAKAPAIGWFGQLFVPVGQRLQSIETGLLISVLLALIGSLALIFRLGRMIAPDSSLPALCGMLLLGAAPGFIGTSHSFMTEGLQLFAVSYAYWVVAKSSSWPPLRTASHVTLAVTLALLVKINTPVYFCLPLCISLYYLWRAVRSRVSWFLSSYDLGLAVLAVALAGAGMAWYIQNGRETWDFARWSASSEMAVSLWGSKAPFFTKVIYWSGTLLETFVAVPIRLWSLTGAACTLVALGIVRKRLPQTVAADVPSSVIWAAALQVPFVIALFSQADNELKRFALALAPSVAIVLMWALAHLRSVAVCVGLLTALSAQWGVLHARSLSLAGLRDESGWVPPPRSSDPRSLVLRRLVELTCTPATAGRYILTGVDVDWLNAYTLQFYSAKAQLTNGTRCVYWPLDGETDANLAWSRFRDLKAPYFVSLEKSALPADAVNRVSEPVLNRIDSDPGFRRELFDAAGTGIVVYRQLNELPDR
jgi:hypothetical protein